MYLIANTRDKSFAFSMLILTAQKPMLFSAYPLQQLEWERHRRAGHASTREIRIFIQTEIDVIRLPTQIGNESISLISQTVNANFPLTLSLRSLLDKRLKVVREIPITISECDGEYNASFLEANIEMSGASVSDAIDMLKEYIGEVFFLLRSEARLGAAMSRQLALLQTYIVEVGQG